MNTINKKINKKIFLSNRSFSNSSRFDINMTYFDIYHTINDKINCNYSHIILNKLSHLFNLIIRDIVT